MKKEGARAEQVERQQRDELAQQWENLEWEQARIDLWRQKLEERELVLAARESAVFQHKLEYRRLKRCPLCGRRGRGDGARGRRVGEDEEARQGNERRRRQVIVHRATTRNASACAAVEGRNDPEDRSHAGQLIRQALGQGTERTVDNDGMETWERTCAAQRMMPQRSPFQTDQADSGVAMHRPLLRC